MNPKLEKELNNLEPIEVISISEKVDDFLVPPEVAAKMKAISSSAIYDAIKRGKLRMVKGITLASLLEYKVNERNRLSGKVSQMKKLEAKIEALEKEKLNSSK